MAELDMVIADLRLIREELRAAMGDRFLEFDDRLIGLLGDLGRDVTRNAPVEVRALIAEYLPEDVVRSIVARTATLGGFGDRTGPSTGAQPVIVPPPTPPPDAAGQRAASPETHAPAPPASVEPFPQSAPPRGGRGWSFPDLFGRAEPRRRKPPKPRTPPRSPQPQPQPSDGSYVVVPVWYATDRNHVPGAPPARRFGADFSIVDDRTVMNYGTVQVSIPRTHTVGRLESPRWFRLEFEPNPERHIVVQDVVELDEAAWMRSIRDRVGRDGGDATHPTDTSRDILIFIHGYLTTWADAARRAAQFAWDLQFQGLPMLYSWPSRGELLSYPADESASAWSAPHFTAVLKRLLADSGARRVHLVAHSMGNRISTDALRVLALEKAEYPTPVREVVFAAPDIDRHTFQEFVTAFNAAVADFDAPRMPRLTLYACGMDSALDLSRRVHRLNRAGDSRKGVVVALPMDTIEVARRVIRAESRDTAGHSYFCSNRVVITDLIGVVLEGSPPPARHGLTPKRARAGPYWRLDGGRAETLSPIR